MSYSVDSIQDLCYPGSSVLINKLGITEEEKLIAVEAVVVSSRSGMWLAHPLRTDFDFSHFVREMGGHKEHSSCN